MLPDRVSNPGPLTYESGALLIALRGPARRLVRTYLVRIFRRRGLSTWCKTNLFFNSRKIFPTKEMHSIALIILYVKNWPKDQSVSINF